MKAAIAAAIASGATGTDAIQIGVAAAAAPPTDAQALPAEVAAVAELEKAIHLAEVPRRGAQQSKQRGKPRKSRRDVRDKAASAAAAAHKEDEAEERLRDPAPSPGLSEEVNIDRHCTVRELKAACRNKRLPTTGKKAELLQRLGIDSSAVDAPPARTGRHGGSGAARKRPREESEESEESLTGDDSESSASEGSSPEPSAAAESESVVIRRGRLDLPADSESDSSDSSGSDSDSATPTAPKPASIPEEEKAAVMWRDYCDIRSTSGNSQRAKAKLDRLLSTVAEILEHYRSQGNSSKTDIWDKHEKAISYALATDYLMGVKLTY